MEGRLWRRDPFPTAIPRMCVGGLKPEITARAGATRPGCYRVAVVKGPVTAGLGRRNCYVGLVTHPELGSFRKAGLHSLT